MKKLFISILALVLILIGAFIILRHSENRHYKNRGKQLILKVENYNKNYGEFPKSVDELNVEPQMGEGPYYEKVDSSKYIVYYNIGFDNTLTYYSDSQTWKESP